MIRNKLIAMAATLALAASLGVKAEDRTFPSGSLIIPMDSLSQNTDADGVYLAYGFVFKLMQENVTVYSIIDPSKTSNTDPDLVVPDGVSRQVVHGSAFLPPDSVGSLPDSYLGGPYMIDASEADEALGIIQAFPEYEPIVIHEFMNPVDAPVAEIYDTQPRQIAILESLDENGRSMAESIMVCYLRLAGIPADAYNIITEDDVLAGALVPADYYILWMPHWVVGEQANPASSVAVVDKITEYVNAGGNVLSSCKAIDSMELGSEAIMTEGSLGINGDTVEPTQYAHFDIPFSQIGDYQFLPDLTDDTQAFRAYQPGDILASGHINATAAEWEPNANLVATDSTETNPWVFYSFRKKDSDENKGNLHFVSGHRYASCDPTIQPGQVYRMSTTMSACTKKRATAFWDTADPCITVTLFYQGGDEEISITLCEGDYIESVGNEFRLWTEDPAEDPDRFGTNYGPGCRGGGSPKGTDHMDGLFIQNLTDNSNIVIDNIKVEWTCAGPDGALNEGCPNDFQFEQFDIRTDNGNCGNSSCVQCTNVYEGGKSCEEDGEITFVPIAKSGSDLTFDGGLSDGVSEDGSPEALNAGGVRYILNTLFNNIVNPLVSNEFARSGPVVSDGVVYFGTFEYPGNAGHFRAWEIDEENDAQLNLKWDAMEEIPSFVARNLWTKINGTKYDVKTSNAAVIEAYMDDPTDTVLDVEISIDTFRGKNRLGKRLGGVERSTAAIVPPNDRANANRVGLAYFGTTYGVLEMVKLEDGEEYGGYVPAPVLKNLHNISTNDPNRPRVDASPTVLDAYLLTSPSDPTSRREWRTVLLMSHGIGAEGLSALDVTDPGNISILWEKFDSDVFGHVSRATVGRYKKTVNDQETLGYAAYFASNMPGSEKGFKLFAYDLQTGDTLWGPLSFPNPTSSNASGQNDIPPEPAVWDFDDDNFDDRLFVGDMVGRLWQVDAVTGDIIPPSGGSSGSSFYDTESGTTPGNQVRPIGASPSVGRYNGRPVVAFGTGGADWSNATNNFVIALDAEDASTIVKMDIGSRRLYFPIVIAGDRLVFTAISGTLNSTDPNQDLPSRTQTDSTIFSVPLETTEPTYSKAVTKSSSSSYVRDGQTYTGSMGGELERAGEKKENNDKIEQLFYKYWRDMTNVTSESNSEQQ